MINGIILPTIFVIKSLISGTFQAEKEEKVIYGLVHPLNCWDPIYIQARFVLFYPHLFGY